MGQISQAWPGLLLCELEIYNVQKSKLYLNKKFRESIYIILSYNLSADYPLFIHQKLHRAGSGYDK